MCVQDAEEVREGMEDTVLPKNDDTDSEGSDKALPLHSQIDFSNAQNEDWDNEAAAFDPVSPGRSSFPLESISEDSAVADGQQILLNNFLPALRSGEWSDIGGRQAMEDTHICIPDLAKNFGYTERGEEVISFYGVFDGHCGKDAAQFVRDHLPRIIVEDADFPLKLLPRIIVEDADFPLKLQKVVMRSFMETDAAFANYCSADPKRSSGTTALTAMIFGRSLLVANVGDCRAVLSRCGVAIKMSEDHRTCCENELMRIKSLGGFVYDGYLNGQLGLTRALGDWHIEGLKEGGPLSAEPELKLRTLTNEDEFLIIGSDGMWDLFTDQNAVDFARRKLQEHNNVKLCCEDIINEAKKRGATDNLTVVMVCFHSEPPPPIVVQRPRVRRCISAESLENIKSLLQG